MAEQLRRWIADRLARRPAVPPVAATPPHYDREYFDALQVLDEEARQ